MTAEPAGKRATSLLESLIGRQKPWVTACISLLLILVPPLCAYLDGVWSSFLGEGVWRVSYLPITVIIYILIVAPIMGRMDARVVESFRPLVLMDDAEFDRLVDEASRISPLGELLAFGAGGVFGRGVGLGNPTYIPAVHTDFVFAAIAEELGLAGALAVIAL